VVSSDGYPQAVAALKIADDVLGVAHARQMTLPHIELGWHDGEPSLEVKWYPTIFPEPATALIEAVRSAFVKDGEEMDDRGSYISYETDLHGITVDFTVYTR
jgi:hypothetical protein